MQLALAIDGRQEFLITVHQRLRRAFGGPPSTRVRLDPVGQIILGIISSRTRNSVSAPAFKHLVVSFSTWEAVRDAPVTALHPSLKGVTFAETKARHIKAALQAISVRRGDLSLEFLADWPADEALCWLERLPGVGRKIAASALNFSTLRMRALVVDLNHLRVMRRLGLAGPATTIDQAYSHIMPELPVAWNAEDLERHHWVVKQLGQRICHHKEPACAQCPLNDICASAQKRNARAVD